VKQVVAGATNENRVEVEDHRRKAIEIRNSNCSRGNRKLLGLMISNAKKHSLWTTTGVEGQRERGMTASSLPLVRIRQCCLLQAGCSHEVEDGRSDSLSYEPISAGE
jgi:hypothetical protein